MGKLKELIQKYLKAPRNSPAEAEIASEIMRISDWMMAQGYSDKPVTLPKKKEKYKYRLDPKLYEVGSHGIVVTDYCLKNDPEYVKWVESFG